MNFSLSLIEAAPALPGLSFRNFRGDEDFPRMADVIAAAKVADQVERSESPDDLRNSYQHLKNCDPFQDVLIAEVDGRMVAYSRVTWFIDQSNRQRIYQSFGFIRPEFRRRGLGRAMLHYNQRRLRQIATGHPQNMECRFESFAHSTEKEATALLLADGYQVVRNFYEMMRPDLENIPDLPLPEGLEVRPAEPEQYRQIWDASIEAFRDHWGFVAPSDEDYQSYFASPNFQPQHWQVAWAGDEIAGSIQAYIDQRLNEEYHFKRGWTEEITTRRPWRRRGLASALIARSLKELKAQGMQQAALGVDTENLSGALHVYEKMGFQVVRRNSLYRKPLDE